MSEEFVLSVKFINYDQNLKGQDSKNELEDPTDVIIFPWDVEKDLSIYWTIQKYKVIDYIFGIGYKVQNLTSNKISKFITGEVKSPNCKKFERIITTK